MSTIFYQQCLLLVFAALMLVVLFQKSNTLNELQESASTSQARLLADTSRAFRQEAVGAALSEQQLARSQALLTSQISSFNHVEQLQPRRNHGCAFLRSTEEMVLLGGRLARGIEVFNSSTAASRLVVETHPLLDVHHHVMLGVEKVAGGGEELWVVCGFSTGRDGLETQRENTLVVDPSSWEVREGPPMDEPRGACGALPLHLDGPQAPPLICLFGGSKGPHNSGTFTTTVSCLDRASGEWRRPLPQLPWPADHLNVVLLPGGDPCGVGGDPLPQRLLLMNFRDRSYGEQYTQVWALDLLEGPGGGLIPGTAWYLFADPMASPPRDAAGILLSPSGRFVLSFGGITYAREPSPWSRPGVLRYAHHEIRALDVCTRDWVGAGRMRLPRFAVVTCASPAGAAITCGGTTPLEPWHTARNIQDCEAEDLARLEQAALAAVATKTEGAVQA